MELLTVKDLSLWLKLSENYIYKLVSKRRIPFLRIGSSIRFDPEAIRVWLKEKEKPSLEIFDFFQKMDKNTISYEGKETHPMAKRLPLGRVYLRGSKWYMDFTIDGKRVRRACRYALTEEQAIEELKMAVVEAFQGKVRPNEPKAISFMGFSKLYIETYAKTNKRSWKLDSQRVEILSKFIGSKLLTSITPFDLESVKAKILKMGRSKSTWNRYLALLKRMFNLACQWGYLKENPAKGLKKFSEVESRRERILTLEEEMRLISKASPHIRPIIVVALQTGMRRGELLNLQWKDVDFKNKLISIRHSKSGKPRKVPMNQIVYQELISLRLQNPSSEYVFVNPKTGERIRSFKTAWKLTLKRAQIEDLRFHDLRHCHAVKLIQNRIDVETVKRLLGHSSITTTERYLASDIERMRQAVEALAQIRHKEDEGLTNALQKLN